MATILHVDMDAFFASVEQRQHPDWRGRPVIVGAGPHERGVVSTCSYEARRFGVHSAMPSRTAYELCPQAIFVRPNRALYESVSAAAFEIFGHYSPYVEGVSIDEAFLDISGTLHLHGSARALGEALRREIRASCGITCSVGIASNRLMAKIGSEQHKPDGLTLLPSDPTEIAAFLAEKPLGILWGIGEKTVRRLKPYGLVTCGHLQRLPEEQLAAMLGSREAARTLRQYAFGQSDETVHWQPSEELSVSREHTFARDEADRAQIRARLLELVADVGRRFREKNRWARTARIKIRTADFKTQTRQIAFDAPARDDFAFRQKALELFDREPLGIIRLIGFGVTNIQDSPDGNEPLLFDQPNDERRLQRERLSETLDQLRARGFSC